MRNFAADGRSGAECTREEEQREPAGWELVIYTHVCFTEAFIKLLITNVCSWGLQVVVRHLTK